MTRTGRYKPILLFGNLASSFSYLLLFFTWHGDTTTWEALYIAPSGFGTGIAQTAVFTSIQASIGKKQRAPALAGMYLTMQLGLILGMGAVGTTLMETVRWKLDILLRGLDLGSAARSEVGTTHDHCPKLELIAVYVVDCPEGGVRHRLPRQG